MGVGSHWQWVIYSNTVEDPLMGLPYAFGVFPRLSQSKLPSDPAGEFSEGPPNMMLTDC